MSQTSILKDQLLQKLGIGPSRFPLFVDESLGHLIPGRKRFIALAYALFKEPETARFTYPWSFSKPEYVRETRRRYRVNLVQHKFVHLEVLRRRLVSRLRLPPLVLATFAEMESSYSVDTIVSNHDLLDCLVLFVDSRRFEVQEHSRTVEEENRMAFPLTIRALFEVVSSDLWSQLRMMEQDFPEPNLLRESASLPFQLAAASIAASGGPDYRQLDDLLESVLADPENQHHLAVWRLLSSIAFGQGGVPLVEICPNAVHKELSAWIDAPKAERWVAELIDLMRQRLGKLGRLRQKKTQYSNGLFALVELITGIDWRAS